MANGLQDLVAAITAHPVGNHLPWQQAWQVWQVWQPTRSHLFAGVHHPAVFRTGDIATLLLDGLDGFILRIPAPKQRTDRPIPTRWTYDG